jgi:hypothetical protein
MAKGTAIHIGLNRVDPDAYAGWTGVLSACENDALAMQRIAEQMAYGTRVFLSEDATAGDVFGAIGDAAASLAAGDICVITYAGHGGQFKDLTGEEPDSRDETWLLFDREVLDDEIHQALSAFKDGVRIVVLSDSCHSGSVIRALLPRSDRVDTGTRLRSRGVPEGVQDRVLAANRDLYRSIRARTPARDDASIRASVLLISGCQDNQESMEGDDHGAFTAELLRHWNNGAFTGDYVSLHDAILRGLPPTQSPNFLAIGPQWPAFHRQRPFTIAPPGPGPGQTGQPGEPGQGGGSEPSVPGQPKYRITISLEVASGASDPIAKSVIELLRTMSGER